MRKILFFLLLFNTTLSAQVDLNMGLRAYYPFTGNANDASGNNNNPVFNNATPAPDRFGNPASAYQFNGINNYIRVPNSPTLNQANLITLCAWVKVAGFYQGTCHGNSIFTKGHDSDPPGNYHFRFDDHVYTNAQNCSNPVPDIAHENFYGVGTSTVGAPYTPYIQNNEWYCLVYTYDGITAKLYVNCQLKTSKVIALSNFTNVYDMFIGKMDLPSYPYWFNGVIDEIRIYNRVLNTDEINAYGDCAIGVPDLTSSQFYSTTQVQPGGTTNELLVIRNVGTGPTSAPFNINFTNYSALTGLTVTPIPASTNLTIGFSNYTISSGWSFNPATGTFTCSNVIPAGGASNLGLLISRGTGGSAGANGNVTQTTTIPGGTGGGETPTNNNSISNFLLKNNQ